MLRLKSSRSIYVIQEFVAYLVFLVQRHLFSPFLAVPLFAGFLSGRYRIRFPSPLRFLHSVYNKWEPDENYHASGHIYCLYCYRPTLGLLALYLNR